ncbi:MULTISPECIES: hypothetical protein [Nocardia]|uniref:hypothetical protein n=1 Tax=Nocardia TaxID=1817 RepID=UPI001895A9E4|nr:MULTISPECIES: hypothetical protein [Nocardia]MBF6475666.1 hypothetical protein [Nocardia abscessus]MDE1674209.1 hypothetical protein [Nocardia gipuzkoensis]
MPSRYSRAVAVPAAVDLLERARSSILLSGTTATAGDRRHGTLESGDRCARRGSHPARHSPLYQIRIALERAVFSEC